MLYQQPTLLDCWPTSGVDSCCRCGVEQGVALAFGRHKEAWNWGCQSHFWWTLEKLILFKKLTTYGMTKPHFNWPFLVPIHLKDSSKQKKLQQLINFDFS
jgi:hypothetical protein